MRTTVDIPDALYRRLKARAATDGRSVKALILQSVDQLLRVARSAPVRRVQLPIVRAKRPSALQLDNARIYDVISFP